VTPDREAPQLTRQEDAPAVFQDDHVEDKGSGVLRASVFGASDGLVSNAALVMGVAGGTSDPDTVVLAGTAGLLAGAFSMAAGEYVSMRTQREVLERELRLEREHIVAFPKEEEAHLARMLADEGLEPHEAQRMSAKIHEKLEAALDFHARFELGINPHDLGAPTMAALSSFTSFVLGALVPLVPWLVTVDALAYSVALSALSLLGVGAAVTRLTHRSPIWGALRQFSFGAAAATVTYAIGSLIGG